MVVRHNYLKALQNSTEMPDLQKRNKGFNNQKAISSQIYYAKIHFASPRYVCNQKQSKILSLMRTKLIALMAGFIFAVTPVCGQRAISTPDYNYQKAREALFEEEDDQKALKLVNEVLEEDDHHADAYCLRASIYYMADRNSAALRDLALALKYQNSKSDVKKCTLYGFRGTIYSDMEKYDEAITEFENAVRWAKKEDRGALQDYKFELAQAYYLADKIEQAEEVYLDMLKDDSGDGAAMVGLSRNCLARGQYEKGLEWLEKAEAYDNTYAQIYRLKMQLLDKLGRVEEAADAAVRFWALDDDSPLEQISLYAGKNYSYGVAKAKAMMNQNPEDTRWPFLLIQIYEDHSDYRSALSLYEKLENEQGRHPLVSYWKAVCYSELGDFEKALREVNSAVESSGDNSYIGERGDIYRSAGRYEEAIADYTTKMDEDPTKGYYYYAIGWCHELQGDTDKALDFYNRGIDVDKNYPYLFISRGDLLRKSGRSEEAVSDYERVLELDNETVDGSCRHYALHGLGREEEAIEWIDRIIDSNPEDGGGYYDKACLLGRMGKTEEGMKALETAFEKGYRRFEHLVHDDDMNPYRNTEKYQELVEKYQALSKEEQDTEEEGEGTPDPKAVTQVQMKKMSGGTYEVPCSINGLPLKFIFDTGASDVTLSSVEANFMLKNDYLSAKDFRGKRDYLNASGEIVEGSVVCLKEVSVGDVTLKNINASVVKNQTAPLLLGQSVLERFGTITIDNINSQLIIKQ